MSKHHLPHVCELPLIEGQSGYLKALAILKGVQEGFIKPSIKWDGAPAIKCGFDPADGRFFVAKKSMAHMFKGEKDFDAIGDHDLRHKLETSYAFLSQLLTRNELPNVRFGDMLYTRNSLAVEDIDGKAHFTFTPNTITYAVRLWHSNDTIGSFGFVFHEGWGRSHPNVYQPLNYLRYEGFKDERFAKIMNHLVTSAPPDFDVVNSETKKAVQKYVNHVVRTKPEFMLDVNEFTDIHGHNESRMVLSEMFNVIASLHYAKRVALEYLNKGKTIGTYLRDESGTLIPCGHEGFVAHGVKLVNRMEFAKANFKKWDSKKKNEEVQRIGRKEAAI